MAGCLFAWYLTGVDPAPRRPGAAVRLAVLVAAAAAHDVVAKLAWARSLPAGAGSPEQLRTAAELLYYGGTAVEALVAGAVMARWYARSGRDLRRAEARAARVPAGRAVAASRARSQAAARGGRTRVTT
ncbi:hypothetical protein GCM10011594_10620 [Nakamurella endophytica]|uniref:Uncharacterized protein n=1 Tax=Nakamurella endophytica TaxID=1748367 RepID=A0A917SR24_9ACTN|nr:hypothetical protein GCM10011594_10620 [Nakamurella endophytica]